jgi:hypothetical protein
VRNPPSTGDGIGEDQVTQIMAVGNILLDQGVGKIETSATANSILVPSPEVYRIECLKKPEFRFRSP